MREWQGKRYWLVGASDGLGAELAKVMSRAGAEVILSARSEEKLAEVTNGLQGKASYQVMDVTDDASVKAAAEAVGDIDGVVLLSGIYWPFGAKNWNAEQATEMADTNFTGFVRVLGQVVPKFVEDDKGHVVITSSLAAYRGLPRSIGYTASKAASMSLAECMYADLRDTNIDVQLVNPGFIKTQMTAKNDFKMPFILEPEIAAREVFEHMNDTAFKKSFPYFFSLLFRGGQFLPDWLYYRLFR